jgi:hypothetical protein
MSKLYLGNLGISFRSGKLGQHVKKSGAIYVTVNSILNGKAQPSVWSLLS